MTEYNETTGDLEAVSSDHPVLTQLKEELERNKTWRAEAETNLATLNNRFNNLRAVHATQTDSLKELLAEMVNDDEITMEIAIRIADIFHIALTRQVEVDITISGKVSLSVPINIDPDEVAADVFIDYLTFSTYTSDVEVEEQDYEITDYRVVS